MENQEKNETTVLPENPEIMVKNPRIGKVRKLEEEVRRQNELEQLRTKRIRKEQEYIEQMSKAVEDHLRNTREEQRLSPASRTPLHLPAAFPPSRLPALLGCLSPFCSPLWLSSSPEAFRECFLSNR